MSGWSLESGYKEEFIESEYPNRVFGSGHEESLELVLSSNRQDHELMCSGHIRGFVFFLDTPGDTMEIHNPAFTELAEDTLVRVKPNIMTTSKVLRNYKPNQRGCIFNSERRLRFFQSNTWYNCFTECMSNFTQRQCGCTRFSMPSTD